MMRWQVVGLTAVVLAVAGCMAASGSVDDVLSSHSEYVYKLTEDNFDALTSDEPWLLEFYAPWCGHCRKLAPIYEHAAMALQGVMKLGTIDCTVEKRIAQRFGVRGYPTIKFWRDGEARDYRGARDVDSIVRFARVMTAPPISSVDRISINQALNEYPVSFLYVGKEDHNYDVFLKVAKKMQGLVQFLKTSDASLVRKFGVSVDAAVVLITEGLDNEIYDDQFNVVTLEKWIVQRQFPLVSEVGMHNFDDITESGLFTVVAVVADVTHYNTLE
jgi:protein disulfide isomerase